MAVVENRFVCDLYKPVQAQALKGNVFSLDNLGSRLSVLIYNNGQPATISGSVTANCILPDGSTVNVNGGLTTENGGSKAYVDVPQSCLLIPGILKIAIKCTSSSVITTLAAIVANVYMTKTDNVITPSQQLINDWNAEISASLATVGTVPSGKTVVGMINDEAATRASADTAINNKIGDTALPTTAQTLIGAIAEHEGDLTNQQGQITDLKSAIGAEKQLETMSVFGVGGCASYIRDCSINSNGKYTSLNSGNHVLIPVMPSDSIVIVTNKERDGYYAFLREMDNPVNNGVPSFSTATGFTERVKITKNTVVTVTVPVDAQYMYLTNEYNSLSLMPSSIEVNGIEMLESINSKINNISKSRFNGKKISIIGDSIDTFDKKGYKIDGYRMYYPSISLGVTNVNETWWMQVIKQSGAKLEVNASWSGSRATDTHSDPTYPDFYDRVSLVGAPDVIFVTLGTNDSANAVDLGEYDFETTYTSLSESTFRTAYIKGVKGLQALYPDAEIVCISEKMSENYRVSIEFIAKELSVEYIDASDYAGASGVHPGVLGMQQLASLVLYPTDNGLWQKHYPADSNTVGNVAVLQDYKKSIEIADETDFDTLTNVGNYYINSTASAATMTNIPVKNPGRLLVMALMEGVLVQTYYANINGIHIYQRRKNGISADWETEWNEITYTNYFDLSFGRATRLIDTDDLNTYTTPGNYYIGTTPDAQAIANAPTRHPGRLTVMTIMSSVLVQMYIANRASYAEVFIRIKNSDSAWGAWRRLDEHQNPQKLIDYDPGETYIATQGFCITDKYIYMCNIESNDSEIIYKYDKFTFTLKDSKTFSGLIKHGNDFTWNPTTKRIYCATGAASQDIVVLDEELNYIETITMALENISSLSSLAYDPISNLWAISGAKASESDHYSIYIMDDLQDDTPVNEISYTGNTEFVGIAFMNYVIYGSGFSGQIRLYTVDGDFIEQFSAFVESGEYENVKVIGNRVYFNLRSNSNDHTILYCRTLESLSSIPTLT
jgi:hypothetical protein